jgi:hypothetical protein
MYEAANKDTNTTNGADESKSGDADDKKDDGPVEGEVVDDKK